MSNSVIQVENVSKRYRLGLVGTGTLSHDLNRVWAKLRGKPDPLLRVDQLQKNGNGKYGGKNKDSGGFGFYSSTKDDDYAWALKDMSIEVNKGEVLGIIGHNGAGKSTLLKILSRVTAPTTGECRIKGRIASLLEVGTGFHPELTGRENIFLNGAILGMTKNEIRAKFDEIVAFAEVVKYIDTPVKRYSSGMHVRLAFAVAAHLDPEILIVDEVLAVGDAAFQAKCLGKMHDVSKTGRTVLFVSHNMVAIRQLCTRAIRIANGYLVDSGDPESVIREYLRFVVRQDMSAEISFPIDASKNFQMLSVRLVNNEGDCTDAFHCDEPIYVEIESISRKPVTDLYGYLAITHTDGIGTTVLVSDSKDCPPNAFDKLPPGVHKHRIFIPPRLLGAGEYRVTLSFASQYNSEFLVDSPGRALVKFTISDLITARGNNRGGYISTLLPWKPISVREVTSNQTGT